MGITDDKQKRALLLNFRGPKIRARKFVGWMSKIQAHIRPKTLSFEATTEQDKARRPFCCAYAIETDFSLVWLSPIIWREWAGKSESPVYLFKRLLWEFCQAALSVKLSLLTCYLIHKRSSLVIQWEKISRNRSKKMQIRHWAVAVILLYYICSISVHVVRRCG